MHFPKTQRIGLNFTPGSMGPQFIAAKVVLIDRRNPKSHPQVFVLSPESVIDTEDLQALKFRFLSGFSDGSFLPMGDLQSIDRKKKLVKFTDEKLISYEYLVMITNLKSHKEGDGSQKLHCGLNALIDALRIKKNNTLQNIEGHNRKLPAALGHKQVQILHEANPITKPNQKFAASSPDWLFDGDALCYEVQT